MIISDLNYLEVAVEVASIQGGRGTKSQSFDVSNFFSTLVNTPVLGGNSASFSSSAQVSVPSSFTANSYTQSNGQAVVVVGGGSLSQSVSVAAVQVVSPNH